MESVIPLHSLGTRMPEHGRIRMGVKDANRGFPKAIDKLRFTSPDKEAVEQIANLYGGEVNKWNDKKASPPNQWEVITTSESIKVFLPKDSLSIWYEMWSGRGCIRRCDGETCTLTTAGDSDMVDCMCAAENKMECAPKTRLNVILPEIKFGGVWLLTTNSWNAAKELPAMEQMLHQLQAVGIVEGRLRLEKRQTDGGAKKFVVPTIDVDASPLDILEGQAQPKALHPGKFEDMPELVEAEIIDG